MVFQTIDSQILVAINNEIPLPSPYPKINPKSRTFLKQLVEQGHDDPGENQLQNNQNCVAGADSIDIAVLPWPGVGERLA